MNRSVPTMAHSFRAGEERAPAADAATTDLDRVLELFARGPEADQRCDEIAARLRSSATRHTAQPGVHSSLQQADLSRMFLDTAIADGGNNLADYCRFVIDTIVPHSINMTSLRSFGHMTSIPPAFVHGIADVVCRLNQNLVKSDASRVLTLVERQTLATLHRLVYQREGRFYDEHVQHHDSTLGIVCSGGTLANITALWCARNACFPPCAGFEGVDEAGLAAALRYHDAAGAVILGSERMHYSMQKAAAVLGLGGSGVITVGVDEQQRIDLRALEETIAECHRRRLRIVSLVGVAGSTDCGSIDPLADLARIAQRERIHFHVDAAWGASLLFSPRHRRLLAGLEAADSVALDGHKQLYVPVGVGVLLLRDPQAARLLEKSAPYMLHAGSGDLGRFALEGSRAGSALLMHASMRVIGRRGYAALIERHCENAACLATLVAEADDFELLHMPQTNIVLYRYIPAQLRSSVMNRGLTAAEQCQLNTLNRNLQQRQYDFGMSYVSRTTLSSLKCYRETPIVALRAVIGNPLAGIDDMKALLSEQRRIAAVVTHDGIVKLTDA